MLSMYQALCQAFICIVSLDPLIHHIHFTDEETEAQGG